MIWLMEILKSCQEQFLKVLRDKAFNITKSLKYEGYQRGLASIVYKFFNKKSSGGAIENKSMSNQ